MHFCRASFYNNLQGKYINFYLIILYFMIFKSANIFKFEWEFEYFHIYIAQTSTMFNPIKKESVTMNG